MPSLENGKAEAEMRNVTKTKRWGQIEDYFSNLYGSGFGKVSRAEELDISPDGRTIAFTGSMWQKLEDGPQTRICLVDIDSAEVKIVSQGLHSDKSPKWSADGQTLAFLSDRIEKGIPQFHIAKVGEISESKAISSLDHVAEYLHWSPNGKRVLIGMAGRGADRAAADGSGTAGAATEDVPTWMPEVESGDLETSWRTIWVYDTTDGSLRQVNKPGMNVWEANWCGDDRTVAIVSDQPGEEAWYTARLVVIEIESGAEQVIHSSPRQLGLPCASPSGDHVAVVQAACSDRGIIAGDILLFDRISTSDTKPMVLDIRKTDATYMRWRDDGQLFYVGQRGLETVAGDVDIKSKALKEIWASSETCGTWYPVAWPTADGFIAVCESWTRHPEIAAITGDGYRTIVSLDHGGGKWLKSQLGTVEEVKWNAPDGLEIQGLLHLPKGAAAPYPVVLNVHGGPVWALRNWWMGAPQEVAFLVSRGYAVLNVNPRGSGGRGQAFAEMVCGDMGGADTHDLLSGLDALVARGIADPSRLGVTGISYGGFMSSWIITQTDRFAAAVPQAPVNDWFTQHTTSNIPHFDSIFLDREPYAPNGLYFKRSPVRFAGRHSTPVLQIAGAMDRCVPPSQALQYHQALLERGVKSVVVTYPKEGHGVRQFPAIIDLCYRLSAWFETYMPAQVAY
jgi:dipeptidyl aminopeptidase/acylaminoacyl peptidase